MGPGPGVAAGGECVLGARRKWEIVARLLCVLEVFFAVVSLLIETYFVKGTV